MSLLLIQPVMRHANNALLESSSSWCELSFENHAAGNAAPLFAEHYALPLCIRPETQTCTQPVDVDTASISPRRRPSLSRSLSSPLKRSFRLRKRPSSFRTLIPQDEDEEENKDTARRQEEEEEEEQVTKLESEKEEPSKSPRGGSGRRGLFQRANSWTATAAGNSPKRLKEPSTPREQSDLHPWIEDDEKDTLLVVTAKKPSSWRRQLPQVSLMA